MELDLELRNPPRNPNPKFLPKIFRTKQFHLRDFAFSNPKSTEIYTKPSLPLSERNPQTPPATSPTPSPSAADLSLTPTPPLCSPRRLSLISKESNPDHDIAQPLNSSPTTKTPKRSHIPKSIADQIGPKSPEISDSKKRKRGEKSENAAAIRVTRKSRNVPRKKIYYRRVGYDGTEFEAGESVYVKRREDTTSDEEDPEFEECRICFKAGKLLMIECDECLGGFHLKCHRPPLKMVPDEEWFVDSVRRPKDGEAG